MPTSRKRPSTKIKALNRKSTKVAAVSAKQAAAVKGGGRRDVDGAAGPNHNQTLRTIS